MTSDNNLQDKSQFMAPPKTFAGWATNMLVVKPLSWGFGKIKEKLIGSVEEESKEFVVNSAVRNQSKLLIQHIHNTFGDKRIISMDQLMSEQNNFEGISREAMLIVLHHLSTVENRIYIEENLNAAAASHHHKLLLKFAEPHKAAEPITETERALYNLEQTEKFLLEQIEKKENKLTEVMALVKSSLKEGRNIVAKTHLRKKHMLEADLTKTVGILDNIQMMLQRVNSSEGDKDILNTYKIGSDAIKTAFAENGIDVDKCHDIIEDMQDIYAQQEEFESAISEPIRKQNEDDALLEKELMEMLNEETDKNKNTNNIGGGNTKDEAKIAEMDLLDKELEMRLRRLRSNLSDSDLPSTPEKRPTQVGW